MPFQLKEYQRRCLDELAQYLRRVIACGRADVAFIEQTERPYHPVRALRGCRMCACACRPAATS